MSATTAVCRTYQMKSHGYLHSNCHHAQQDTWLDLLEVDCSKVIPLAWVAAGPARGAAGSRGPPRKRHPQTYKIVTYLRRTALFPVTTPS